MIQVYRRHITTDRVYAGDPAREQLSTALQGRHGPRGADALVRVPAQPLPLMDYPQYFSAARASTRAHVTTEFRSTHSTASCAPAPEGP